MNSKSSPRTVLASSLLVLGSLASACDTDDEQTSLRIAAYGEEYVEDLIPAADVVDGWEIELSRMLVVLSDVEADGVALPGSYVVDLRTSSMGQGHALGELMLPSGDAPHLAYRIAPVAQAEPVAATAEDVLTMVDEGLSILVEGQATRGGETIAFSWRFATDTRYEECHAASALSAGGEVSSQLTIHADHLFFDDLDSPEPNVAFDLIAQADGNGDGEVTMEEMRAVDITGQARYQVGSREITDLWSFIEAQTTQVGHIDGEGHCEVGS